MSIKIVTVNDKDYNIVGKSAYESAVELGFEGTEEEWLASLGGKTAYEVAKDNGFEGTEDDWLKSLKGEAPDDLVRAYLFPVEHGMTFEVGGLQSDNGGDNESTNRWRTALPWCDELYVVPDSGITFRFMFYAVTGSGLIYKDCSDAFTESVMLTRNDFPTGADQYKLMYFETGTKATSGGTPSVGTTVDPSNVPLTIWTNRKRKSTTFSVGTINTTSGDDATSTTRVRSDYVAVEDLCIVPVSPYRYAVHCYKADKSYNGSSAEFFATPRLLKDLVNDETAFVRFVIYKDGGEVFVNRYVNFMTNVISLYTPYAKEYAFGIKATGGSVDPTEVERIVDEKISANTDLVTTDVLIDTVADAISPVTQKANNAMDIAEQAKEIAETVYGEYVSDVPENIGVLNAILNFKQLVEIKWSTVGGVPHVNDAIWDSTSRPYPTVFNGIPYSSTRPEALFVPNNVSFHTFMTALKNPNSYLYTVDLRNDPYYNTNGATYYGAVCSTACAYALGIKPNYSTHQWTQIPDMEVIENQSAYGLKLGDTIVTTDSTNGGHVVMVTDITRNRRGKIGHITISEAVNNFCKSTDYTVEKFDEAYPSSTHTYCRYKKLYATQHEQDDYVSVEDETPKTVTYNTDIIPRKGDKANWLEGTDVVLDVLNKSTYTSLVIYKDGFYYDTVGVTDVITLKDLKAGSYKAYLSTGTNIDVKYCYWMVVKATSTADANGSGEIMVTFECSDNATPLWVNWARGDNTDSGHPNNGTIYISTISDSDRTNGGGTYTYGGYAKYKGALRVRVAFQTEYGIIHSELSDVISVS